MLQYLLIDPDRWFDDDRAPASPAPVTLTDASLGGQADDADTPVFDQLRAEVGLCVDDDGRWSAPAARHRGVVVEDTPRGPVPVVVTEPSVALLERTLAALRAWEPYACV